MKRTWISPLMLVAVLVPLLLAGSLACSDLVGSDDGDVARVSEGLAEISLDSVLIGRALVVEGSSLCYSIQETDCAGWCEWEDRDDCPHTYCVKQPPDDSPPPPPRELVLGLDVAGPSCSLAGLSFDTQGRVAVKSSVVGPRSPLFVPIAAVERLAASGGRCVTIQKTCPCWCEWDDRNDESCYPECCVNQPPPDDPIPPRVMVVTLAGTLCYADGIQGGDDPPYGGGGGPPNPPPPGAVARLASAAPGTVCVSIQDGDDGPPYGGGPGGPPPPSGNQ